jgi:hypothetical protein
VTSNGARDFDFLYGTWTFHLRRLRVSTDPDSTEWLESEGTSEAFPILDGLGNIDRLWMPAADGADAFEGCTLRLYDPASDTWRIWWVSTRAPGVLDEPVVGRFDGGRGTFECDDVVSGVAVRVRYTWYADPDEPRFEQSFSRDGGDTWWVNWVTTQRRR